MTDMRNAMGGRIALSALFLVLVGCGNMLPAGVKVITDPPGATVRIGDEVVGKTPVLVPRKLLKDHMLDTYTLVISKKGFRTEEVGLFKLDGSLRLRLRKQ